MASVWKLLLLSLVAACVSPRGTEVLVVTDAVKGAKEVVDFKVAFADSISAQYTVNKIAIDNPAAVPEIQHKIEVSFNNLTQEQFKLLSDHYGSHGTIEWRPNETYRLTDFLPPIIQALDGRWFSGYAYLEPRIPKPWRSPYQSFETPVVSTEVNCWVAAWEVSRLWEKSVSQQSVRFGYFSGSDANDTFINDELFEEVKNLTPEELALGKSQTRNQNLKPGDIFLIYTVGSTYIQPAHVAVWIDEDLYFEKTNSGSLDPFRLARWDDAVGPYIAQEVSHFKMKPKCED